MLDLNLSILWQEGLDGTLWWESLGSGLLWTLAITVVSGVIAFVIGSVMGVLRTTSSKPLAFIGNAYVEFFRNIPLIVQLFVWYNVIPELVPPLKAWVIQQDPANVSYLFTVVGLGLFTAARVAEQMKSGILALSRGQRAAAYALGLTQAQTYRYVLMPMAYRIVIPPLTSEAMSLVKNTSIAFTIGLVELMGATKDMGEETFRFFEAYIAATVLYVVVSMSINRVMAYVERKVAVPGYISGGK